MAKKDIGANKFKSLKEFDETFLPNLHNQKLLKEQKNNFRESGTGLALEMIKAIRTDLSISEVK